MNRIYCRYCGEFLYDADTSSERYSICKYKKPDCNLELTNFNRSLSNAESSNNDFLVEFAKQTKLKLDNGKYPKELKPLLKLAMRKKSAKKLIMVVQKK